MPQANQNNLDTKTLESWLWEAACKIRGAVDAPKFKDYILPLIFLKRLSDVYDDELLKLSEDFEGKNNYRIINLSVSIFLKKHDGKILLSKQQASVNILRMPFVSLQGKIQNLRE